MIFGPVGFFFLFCLFVSTAGFVGSPAATAVMEVQPGRSSEGERHLLSERDVI